MPNRSSGFFSTSNSKEQAKDSGMAIVLILLATRFLQMMIYITG
jgi:hypothetical protein